MALDNLRRSIISGDKSSGELAEQNIRNAEAYTKMLELIESVMSGKEFEYIEMKLETESNEH